VGDRGLELSGITKRYGDLVAVRDLNVGVRPGEVFGFVGSNRAGKTTTMRRSPSSERGACQQIEVQTVRANDRGLCVLRRGGLSTADLLHLLERRPRQVAAIWGSGLAP
jgi:ABC-type Na+ transport system ATPase subunit NatA